VERITLLNSEAVLIANPSIYSDNPILSELSFRISAVLAARNNKYILLNAPNEKLDAIAQLLPGMKSPSVLPLQTAGWSSLHAVVPEDDFWNIITKIKQLGAQGILVLPIEKMIV
ncbi:MAG: ATP phosphoribosyltransferase, partial [Schleiferiaceae bacterium]|nr:ATP phosphoribosyltransferase [Schleiferiaceae bacterium]